MLKKKPSFVQITPSKDAHWKKKPMLNSHTTSPSCFCSLFCCCLFVSFRSQQLLNTDSVLLFLLFSETSDGINNSLFLLFVSCFFIHTSTPPLTRRHVSVVQTPLSVCSRDVHTVQQQRRKQDLIVNSLFLFGVGVNDFFSLFIETKVISLIQIKAPSATAQNSKRNRPR